MSVKPTIRAPRLWRIVGHQVRTAREHINMSGVELALRARISKQALHLIERGRKGARLETLYRIAKATGQPITFFLPPAEDV